MINFGGYLAKLRKERRVTLKDMADAIGITSPYLSDVEKGRRDSFDIERLNKIVDYLKLTHEETDHLMNLAGDQRQNIAPDLPDYVAGKEYINAALRRAKDLDAGEEEWLAFINSLENR
ncbi:helix-turn-helix domain-containing protein [Fundicoccus ignavus]|nr:helix-turn-helix transcriptional regulator [Fundicoccus ignavus]